MWEGQLRGHAGPRDGSWAGCAVLAQGQVGKAGKQGLRRVRQQCFADADGHPLLRGRDMVDKLD